jgi:hypothetical protein
LWRKGIGRPVIEDPRRELEKVSNGQNRDVETKLRERFVTKNGEKFESPSRTRRSFER